MTEDKNTNKQAPSRENETKKRSGKASAFSQILNGDFLTKEFVLNNLNYIFFLIALLLLIIAKGYYGKQISVDIDNAQREYDQNAAEYIEVKSKLETVTRRYKLVERLEKRELKETKNATKVIRLKKKKDE
ncbi:MAG: FtsL-like putative cell division protein [Flavobacteriia bacterium]|nr:FtsL-like putative cell division protein [Flavobacteriia bacterium]